MQGPTRSLLALMAAAALAAGPGVAQETGSGDGSAPTAELPLGEPVAPQVGQLYETEVFESWTIRCVVAPPGQEDACQMYQVINNSEGGRVAEFSVIPTQDQSEVAGIANVVTPLETLLTAGLQVGIDERDPLAYPFTLCSAQGCLSRFGITPLLLSDMKAGETAYMQIVAARSPDQQIRLPVSLSGFTAAYDYLIEQQ